MTTAQGIRAGKAFVELFLDDSKLASGLKSAKRRLQAYGASVRALGTKMFAAGSLVAGPLSLAVNAASDMEETMNKFNVVFGNNAKTVKAWGDNFAGEVGRSKKQVADFLSGTQDLLVPIGFDSASATEMSKQLTGLAIDLASFNNKADDDVIRDLHAALTGSSEVMKKYGVIANETAVKQELLNQGIDKNKATEQQKVMARMAIILRGTTAAQGDAIRSAGSFANQMKALRAKVSDAAVEIGTVLLPIVTPLITKMSEGVQIVAAWVQEHKGLVVVIAKVAAALVAGGLAFIVLGTVLSGMAGTFGVVASVISGVGTAIGVLGSILAALLSPIGLVIAGITALGAYLIYTSKIGAQALDWMGRKFSALKETALAAWQGIGDALATGDIGLAAKILWLTLKLQWQKGVNALNQIWVTVKDFFLTTWTEAVFGAAEIATNAWAGLQSGWTETVDFLADAWALFTTGLTKTWHTTVGFIRKAWVKLKSLFDSEIDSDAEVAKINSEVSGKNNAVDVERDQRIFQREQARKQQLSDIEQQRSGTLGELGLQREAEHEQRRAQVDAEIGQSENTLAQARREWQQAIATAARQRQEADSESGPNREKSPENFLKNLQQQLGGLGSRLETTKEKISATGTFNAASVGGLGGGNPVERTAKASEETAKNTKRILQEAQHGGLVFS